jgi:hypothetical protein
MALVKEKIYTIDDIIIYRKGNELNLLMDNSITWRHQVQNISASLKSYLM